jgi:hypothetical protein
LNDGTKSKIVIGASAGELQMRECEGTDQYWAIQALDFIAALDATSTCDGVLTRRNRADRIPFVPDDRRE